MTVYIVRVLVLIKNRFCLKILKNVEKNLFDAFFFKLALLKKSCSYNIIFLELLINLFSS